jgi:serine/threonine protein phosphatase PrpC
MEDRYFISEDLTFFAVYDGHGGARVADACHANLYSLFINAGKPPGPGLEEAFVKISDQVLADKRLEFEGSTAVVVHVGAEKYTSGNVGDSRAILCRGNLAVNLTTDHKPDGPSEKARIEKLGGSVRWHGYLGPDRLPVQGMGAYRINGNLAVSRAIGDALERPFVSSAPDICEFDKQDDDKFILLASDGLWDVMSSQEVCDFVKQIMAGSMRGGGSRAPGNVKDRGLIRALIETRREKMAHYLVEEALRRGSSDNITCVCIWLR